MEDVIYLECHEKSTQNFSGSYSYTVQQLIFVVTVTFKVI